MTQSIARIEDGAPAPIRRLSVYEGGLSSEAPRVEALAVLSCGYRAPSQGDRPGLPRASRREDARQIHLHDPQGRAPGLAEALKSGEYRRLLIAFPLDDGFIQQRFTRYSASRLEIYGDETALTLIDARDKDHPRHVRIPSIDEDGKPNAEYERLVKTCKADTRVFFCLAEWTADGPEVVFPDGLGLYAIRTTSSHSVRAIQSTIAYTRQFTRGKIAGLPFVLEVDYREVAGPDGSKRTIPVWTITTKPPQGIRLSSRTFAGIATSALEQGSALMLPAPAEGSWEDAEAEGPIFDVDEPSADELATLQRGGLCDAAFYKRQWHAAVKGSALEADEARAAFLATFSQGLTNSLAVFLAQATEEQATALCMAAASAAAAGRTREHVETQAARYEAIFGDEDEPKPSAPEPTVVEGTAEEVALEPAEESPAAPVEMVTSARDKTMLRWAEVYQGAIALDIPVEPFKLPVPRAQIEAATVRVADLIAAKKAELAGRTAPAKPTDEPALPF